MIKIKRVLLFLFILESTSLFASKADSIIYFTDNTILKDIKTDIYVFEDSSSTLSFQDILLKNNFKRSNFDVPNLGVSKSAFWIKFSICNTTSSKNLLLQLSYPLLEVADLYFLNAGGTYSVIEAGDVHGFSDRKYKSQYYIYDVILNQNETKTFYIKVKSVAQILIPLYLGEKDIISESNSLMDIVAGIYIGIILVMFLYNMFIFITVKDITYLYYIAYVLFIGITQITILGYSSKLLWPDNEWLAMNSLTIAASIGSSCIAIFMNSFLKLKTYAPKLVYGVYIIVGLYLCAIVATLTGHQHLGYNIIDTNGVIITVFSMIVSIKMSLQGYKPARYFLLGWTVFMIGVFVFVLRNFGFFSFNPFTNYTMPAGSALEVTLLSFALADKINILKKEKELSQTQALHALMQNKMILTNQNSILETKVGERTKEIENTNNELYKALAELKKAQMHLINTEKITSFAQLQTGTPHQTDNSINLIVSTGSPLKKDLDDIHELLDKYDMASPADTAEKNGLQTDPFQNKAGYQTIKEEMELLFNTIEDKPAKKATVTKGLRVSYQLDRRDLKKIQVSEIINSALALLGADTFKSIKLVKNFSALPEIECFPEKLQPVFIHILTNAIQAIEEKKDLEEKGLLILRTYSDNNNVSISIKDNGAGMTDEVKEKIFESFFTTKAMGKGLGLSTALSIISAHNGTIELNTVHEKGTECLITLPVNYLK